MKKLTLVILVMSCLYTLKAQNDSISFCDYKICVLSRTYKNGYRLITLENGLYSKRYYTNNGRIERDEIFSSNNKPILVNTYNSKGKIKKQITFGKHNYDLCYALNKTTTFRKANERFYIKSFEIDSWEYPNSWFIGVDSLIDPKNEEITGIVINKESGATSNYYTIKNFPLKKTDGKIKSKTYSYSRGPEYLEGYEALKQLMIPNLDASSIDIIHGVVYVGFHIDISGNVSDFKIIQGINEYQNKIALEAISKMGKWVPPLDLRGESFELDSGIPVYFRNEK